MTNGLKKKMMNGNKIMFSQTFVQRTFPSLSDYTQLLKIHLCLYISLSAIFGYVMAAFSFSLDAFLCGFFVFILACGSAVLNNIQDRYYDSFFPRTRNRSLPQKKVSVPRAGIIAVSMIISGLSGLFIFNGFIAFFWGTMAVIFYNIFYTPLKKRSVMAIIPGSVSGMIPPLIGWTAASGNIWDANILITMAVFGLWQIPHFFIILLKRRMHENKPSGSNAFPCFTNIFSRKELGLQVVIWTSLYSLAILLFLVNGSIQNLFLSAISGLNALIIVLLISIIMIKSKMNSFAFAAINLSMLVFLGTGIFDRLLM